MLLLSLTTSWFDIHDASLESGCSWNKGKSNATETNKDQIGLGLG